MSMVTENLSAVQKRIDEACRRARRDPSEVTLIAVSKTKPASMILEYYAAGVRTFGENRPQELRDKIPVCPDDISWHMIGQLQKNKLKYVVGKTALIHSIDTVTLAEAISAEAAKRDVAIVKILLEVNVAGEESKNGIAPAELETVTRQIAVLPRLAICGLMTVAPNVEDAEENRFIFRKLRQLSVDIAFQNIDNVSMNVLSMGMTNDFEIAIEEGATCVRVGRALFGARDT